MSLMVSCVTFNPDGSAVIEYNRLDQDVRENGMMRSQALVLPPSAELIDDVETLQDRASELLERALKLFESTPVAELVEQLEDEDVPSPWDNPRERDIDAAQAQGEARG